VLTILAVGEDYQLLKTRADVLRKTGANVVCATGASALKLVAEWEFDLIVVGHSVRPADAKKIAHAAHSDGSRTLVLLLLSDAAREQAYDEISFDAKSFVEPSCLTRSAVELLNRQARRGSARISAGGHQDTIQ
jgi:DNA-binding NtrC family response regulator